MDYSELLPVINVADGLKRMMSNKKLYAKLLGSFKGRQMTDDLIAAMNGGDTAKIADAAHALKGVSANLSMPELYRVVVEIESAAKAGQNSPQLADEVDGAVNAVIDAIRNLVVDGEMR